MARKEERAIVIKAHAESSNPLEKIKNGSSRAAADPVIAPFIANALPGSQGNRSGAITAPAAVPRIRARKEWEP